VRRNDVTGGSGQPAAGCPQLDGNGDQLSWFTDNLAAADGGRGQQPQQAVKNTKNDSDNLLTQLDGNSDQLGWSIGNLTGMQAADGDIAPILEWLKSGRQKPGVQELKRTARPLKPSGTISNWKME